MKPSPMVVVAVLLFILSVILSSALYHRLPDPVPTHFDAIGRANGFTAKPVGAFIGPILIGCLAIVFVALPRISPRGYRMDRFRGSYEVVTSSTLGFAFVVSVVMLLMATGIGISMNRVAPVAVGVLLLIIGNFMGKLTRNFFFGIRTPWTLASEEVWFRTHRQGGPVLVLAGLILLIAAFFGGGPRLILIVVLAAAVWLTLYSYLIYRRIENGDDDDTSSIERKEQP